MSEAASRPGAEGHRFGPDLSCSECGVTWEAHQLDPRKCVDDTETDPAPISEDEIEIAAPNPKRVGMAAAASSASAGTAGLHVQAVGTD